MQNIQRDNLIFGRYRLHQSLGTGSFGEVFYAEDIQFDPPRAVAFKLLHAQYISDPNVREDLKREAGILARFDAINGVPARAAVLLPCPAALAVAHLPRNPGRQWHNPVAPSYRRFSRKQYLTPIICHIFYPHYRY